MSEPLKIRNFMDDNFLLSTETAKQLYHDTAGKMPIIDYHCHISPKEIAEDIRFSNLTRAWLSGDHYKWRAMRACGIDEGLITGTAADKEKFYAWASCMPQLIGNPLYHWSHLELKKYCGIDIPLSPETADEIWERGNKALEKLTVKSIIGMSNVETICTTDDPADSLEYHNVLSEDNSFDTNVLPAFRPDRILGIEKDGYARYISDLARVSAVEIQSIEDLKLALLNRIDVFEKAGCRGADHGLYSFPSEGSCIAAEIAFKKAINGELPETLEMDAFRYEILIWLAKEYFKRDWVMEIHYGVLRNTNTAMMEKLGPDTGFDNMGQVSSINELTMFLNNLNTNGELPKTLLFSVNPADNAPLCTLAGAFGERVQQGSAWWFNDTVSGMRAQIAGYASMLPFGKFIGFLTDSRSFLSYTRHEYFRRLICEWIGTQVENGEFTDDPELLKSLVANVCYHNTKRFFNF